MEMNFCRRCGTKLKLVDGNAYECENGHSIFWNSSPAATIIVTKGDQILSIIRGMEPGKGSLDLPGGFCNLAETLEDTAVRELLEETGIMPSGISKLEFVMSAIDPYQYGGEEHVGLNVIFHAELITDAEPKAADDAAETHFMALKDVDLNKVFFPSIRAGYAWAKARQQ